MKKSIALYYAISFLLLFTYQSQAQCLSGVYSLCNNSTYTLTAENGLSNVKWQKKVGNNYVTISNSNSITVSDAGKYKYVAEDVNGCQIELCCPYEFLPDASTQIYALCQGETYTIAAQAGLNNIQWQKDSGSGFVNINGANSKDLMVTTIGRYKYTATDLNGCVVDLCCPFNIVQGTGCCTTAPTYTLCQGETYTITAQAGLNNIQWQKLVGNTYTDIVNETATNYTVSQAGKYRYVAKDANACAIELCCPFDFTPCCPVQNYTACQGETYTLTAQVGMSNIQWQKEHNGMYIDIAGANNASLIVSEMGKYRYTATDNTNGCIEMCCPFLVTYYEKPDFSLQSMTTCSPLSDVKIMNNTAIPISQVKIDNGSFQNYPSSSILTGLSIGTHSITLKSINGCEVTKTVLLQSKTATICTSVKIVRR